MKPPNFQKRNREVKVKRSRYGVGVALLCFAGFGGPQRQVFATVPRFFFLYKLTVGRVKLKLLKMKKVMFTAFAVGLCMTANVMAQVPSYVPTNGLVGWWPFNGNANDESGNGNNGTVNGATLTTDRFGMLNKAYDFDGISSDIECGNLPNASFNSNSNFCFNFWYNPSGLHDGRVFTFWPNSGDLSFAIQCTYESNKLAFNCSQFTGGPNAPYAQLYPNSTFNSNIWYNITLMYSNNILMMYRNGIIIDSINYSGPFAAHGNNSVLRLGLHPLEQLERFAGKIDDIGIWNRALTQQEISDLFVLQNCSNDLTISPISNSQNIGGNVTFSANTSDANASYSWQSDFGQGFQTLNNYGNYSGANTNTLTISNVQLAEHNQQIRAISISGDCVDTSNIATIQIADTCITNVTIYDTLLTTVTDTLIINTTLSLPAPNNENTILIYPNPAIDHITIDNGNFAAMAGYSIKIENNAGQQVFQSAINQAQFYLDLSTWTGNGLYFVHLIDPQNNTVTVRKIVLQ